MDEAGDLTLFNKRGEVIVGTEGCSKYFVLGVSLIDEPNEVRKRLHSLREEVTNDPYLQSIPSLQKTKIAFHAKDDCPEVKMAVYKLMAQLPVKLYAIVRRKAFLVEWVRKQNQFDSDWRYSADKIYDACVKRLFKDRLHQAEKNHIIFARRGKTLRNTALTHALQRAKYNFKKDHFMEGDSDDHIDSNYPSHEPLLQVIDYGLWALQRLYERLEMRYFDFIKNKFVRIMDLDDKREKDYGVYYDERNVLTAEKIKNSLKG